MSGGFLKYGSEIYLYNSTYSADDGDSGDDMDMRDDGKQRLCGFISCKGFLNNNVYFQTVAEPVNDSMEHLPNISNMRDFVMIITPKLKFEFHRDYMKAVKELKGLYQSYNILGEAEKAEKKKLLESFEMKVKKAKERAEKEDKINKELIRSKHGQMVTYGSEIQFMHKDSNYFLMSMNECSQTQQIGYRVEISNEYNSKMIFSLLPRYKSRRIGDCIQFTDEVFIKNIKINSYLSISTISGDGNPSLNLQQTNPYVVQKVFIDFNSTTHVVYLGYEQQCTWQLFLHAHPNDQTNTKVTEEIVGHDVITIKHSELDGYLCSSIPFQGESPEIYFRIYQGQHEEEIISLNCFWEVCHEDKLYQGRPFDVKTKERIVLRHFNSGRLLCVDERNNLVLEKISNDAGGLKPDPVYLSLEPIQKGQNRLLSNQSYSMHVHQDQTFVLSHSQEFLTRKNLESNVKTLELEKEMLFTALEDSYFYEKRLRAVLKTKTDFEEGYMFKFADNTEKTDMLFVRSCMIELLKLAQIFRFKQESNARNPQTLVEAEVLLARTLCFIFDVDYTPEFDYKSLGKHGLPLRYRQKIIKDLNMIELMMELIHYPFKNNMYDKKDIHKSIYAKEIIQLCYTTIRCSIMKYRPNELYASQWLNLLIEYSLSSLDDSIGANSTLTELIDNNERILEAQIKKGTIDKFVYNLIESRGNKKYIDILRAVCICNGKPIEANQKILSEIILKDNINRKKLIPELKMEGSEVLIRSPWVKETNTEWISFANFRNESERMDNLRYFSYYSSLMKLLGDLCLNRNYIAINVLQSYMTLNICIEVICSEEYNWSIRSAFCTLTTNLWINVSPFMYIQFPDNLKVWSDVNNDQVFIDRQTDGENDALKKFEPLKSFVLKFMKSIKHSSQRNLVNKFEAYSGFLISIIMMTKKMILLGFFSKYASFIAIFEALIEILITTDQMIADQLAAEAQDSEKLAGKEEENEIIETCTDIKIKICLLLKLFSEIKTDLRANRLISLYKEKTEGGNTKINKGKNERKIIQSKHAR